MNGQLLRVSFRHFESAVGITVEPACEQAGEVKLIGPGAVSYKTMEG